MHATFSMLRGWSRVTKLNFSTVPLARRNLFASKRRLLRSILGIGFAVLIMMVELGFRAGFVGSVLLVVRQLDGDLMLVSSQKYQFDRRAPFSRRQLHAARAIRGVASARPLYVEWILGIWKNPGDQRLVPMQLIAFDPDQPVFLLPEVSAKLNELRQSDTVLVDRRVRPIVGQVTPGDETELKRQKVRVIGTFSLGPDFYSDGTIITSDRNFFKLLGVGGVYDAPAVPEIEVGVVKVLPGYRIADVQRALRATLPAVTVLTKAELIEQEAAYHEQVSPAGPIFGAGVIVGFAIGLLICYQILLSELSDQLSQFATLKAIGYQDSYLVKVVLQQAVFYGLIGYALAWMLCWFIFRLIRDIVLLPLGMSVAISLTCLALTLGMCIVAAAIAVRRVIAADPADVF
jgi:DevC protein